MTITIENKVVKGKKSKKVQDTLLHALKLCKEFVPEKDVTIKLGRGVKQAGCAVYYRTKDKWEMVLSRPFIEDTDFSFMDDTIRHEIAHIAAGHDNGHNHVWMSMARKFGASPSRCHDTVLKTRLRYVSVCPSCSNKTYYARKLKNTRSCGKCYPYGFNERFTLAIYPNPEYAG